MLNAKLVIVGGGDAKVSEIQLKLPTTIGRSREAKLKLPHPLVSRRHCELFEREGQLYVRDLGSLNGTYINSEKIDREQVLQPNQLLTLGTVTFRAIYDAVEAATDGRADAAAQKLPLSERPTEKAPPAPSGPPPAPSKPISEIETESDVAGHDTDKNLPSLSDIDFSEMGDSSPAVSDVGSSIFIDNGTTTDGQSISISEIEKLPGGPAQLSFVGGIETDASSAKPKSVGPAELPQLKLDGDQAAGRKPGKHRPR